jgi:hypothetical protein
MPTDEPDEPQRGALPGRTGVAINVSVEGVVERGFRPGQGASNPDWNSGENNLGIYRDPAEVAWERQERANQMSAAENPENQEQIDRAGEVDPEAEARHQSQTDAGPEVRPNGSAAVQQSQVPKRKRGRPPKSQSNEGAGASGGDHVHLSDVRGRRDPDPSKLQTAREPATNRGREVARKPGNLAIRPKNGTSGTEVWGEAQRNQVILGFQAFDRFIEEAPVDDSTVLFNDISRRVIDAGNRIEERRQEEKRTANCCRFCGHEFTYRGSDTPFARRPFDLANGVIEVVIACRRSKCVQEFDDYVNDMSMSTKTREHLHE